MPTLQSCMVGALREHAVRTIHYIHDDIHYIMAKSKSLALEHTTATTYLLENLGFIVHRIKLQLTPTQELEFLGMMMNTFLKVPVRY